MTGGAPLRVPLRQRNQPLIVPINQGLLFAPCPLLDLLLTFNRFNHISKFFRKHKLHRPLVVGEASINQALLMLVTSSLNIIRDACVITAIRTFQDVNKIALYDCKGE